MDDTRGGVRLEAEERFLIRIKRGSGNCWTWDGPTTNGYSRFWNGHENEGVHRFAYRLYRGPIPEGLDLDHLCHNRDPMCPGGVGCWHRRCVNPWHLVPATRSENLRRSTHVGKWMAYRTHCVNGHPFVDENVYRSPRKPGTRQCRACSSERKRAARGARYMGEMAA